MASTSTSTSVNEKLGKVAKAFATDESQWADFVKRHADLAVVLTDKAKSLGCGYEFVYVPAKQTLRSLLDLLQKTRVANGYKGDPAWLYEPLWTEEAAENMRDKDNFGITEEAQLSALLLNPNGGNEEGLFFAGMTANSQMEKANELVREKSDVQYLSVAEYICANIIRAANNEKLLDVYTHTRFIQYGWIYVANDCYVPNAHSRRGEQFGLGKSDGYALWGAGVRFSAGK